MIVSKIIQPPGILIKSDEKITAHAIDSLNEIKRENIVQITTSCNMNGIVSYIVFYEKENVCTCPGCGHDISNTFSLCPNCGRSLK